MRHYVKVIRVTAEDSPNIQLALQEQALGKEPSGKILVPGVLTWDEYKKRRATWDKVRQTIGLDAQFYEGAETLAYPPDWLDRVERAGRFLAMSKKPRKAKAMGVDSAEGGDNSCWCVGDEKGVIEMVSIKTFDTTKVVDQTIHLMKKYGLKPHQVYFDRGGGGKNHADWLRRKGYDGINTISFGGAATDYDPPSYYSDKRAEDKQEIRSIYRNRRSEMYLHNMRNRFNPMYRETEQGGVEPTNKAFGIPPEIFNRKRDDGGPSLREQLAVIPLLLDDEGNYYLLPKRSTSGKKESLTDLLDGYSPDEADALALMIFGLDNVKEPLIVGAMPDVPEHLLELDYDE